MNRDSLVRMFEVLVPPKRVTIEDVTGREYSFPSALSANRQIEVFRVFDEIRTLPVAEDLVAGVATLGDDPSGAIGAIGAGLLRLSQDAAFRSKLYEVFAVAHPQVVKAAEVACREEGFEFTPGDVGDLFAMEEIVAGLVPFFLRLLRRGAGVLSTVLRATEEAPE